MHIHIYTHTYIVKTPPLFKDRVSLCMAGYVVQADLELSINYFSWLLELQACTAMPSFAKYILK